MSTVSPAIDVVCGVLENAEVLSGANGATGRLQGCRTTWQFVTRGSGSSEEQWTEVTVLTPTQGLVLNLRPSRYDDNEDVLMGRLIDVQFDDPPFDVHFVVSGLPSDVLRQWLDATVRSRLLDLRPVSLSASESSLCLSKEGWVSEPDKIRSMLDVAATLGSTIAHAWRVANQAGKEGYRPDPGPLARVEERRADELEELQKAQRRMSRHTFRRAALSTVGAIAAMATWFALMALLDRAGCCK